MKKCYELVMVLEDGSSNNLIFSSRKKAFTAMHRDYPIGSTTRGFLIKNSYIVERILF